MADKTGPQAGQPPTQTPKPEQYFLSDVQELRRRARQHIEDGAVTAGYGADKEKVIAVLNEALATEIVCVLRYKRHYFMAQGIASDSVKAEFLEHATEEQEHADRISERIVQLGGEPDFAPATLLDRSHADYDASLELQAMIRANLVAERVAIEAYSQMIRLIGDKDSTTRRILESILSQEQEHADELSDWLTD